MNAFNPTALFTFDVEKRWTAARTALKGKVASLRACGCKVSHYRESIIITFPDALGGVTQVLDTLRPHFPSDAPDRLIALPVPSLAAARGVAYGRRFRRGIDWRGASR